MKSMVKKVITPIFFVFKYNFKFYIQAALKVQVQQFSKGNCLCQELTITSNLRKEP